MKVLLISLVWCITHAAFAQDCIGTFNPYLFNVNKIKTGFIPMGEKFVHYQNGNPFIVPFPEFKNASTLNAGAAWIGSKSSEKLQIAAHQYSINQSDFRQGPLDPQGMKYGFLCEKFDHIWSVFREDILRHQVDFIIDGMIDNPITSVFGWPADGNDFFQLYNGFALPTDHKGGWADFYDKNSNGKYEPDLGEYPIVLVKDKLTVPDQIMWMVYNDQGQHLLSHGNPLGVELQLTVYAYYCQDNPLLNHSLFNTYKIINQNAVLLDSVYFGLFNSYDIGCNRSDDYIGSDSVRQVEFAYNSLPIDGKDCNIGYGDYPPIQSMTYLSHPMYSFIGMLKAHSEVEFFRLLTGFHRNGRPIYTDGNGIDSISGSQKSKFLFHGNPNDPGAWSETAVASPAGNRNTVSSVFLGKLEAKETARIETVYTFHRDSIHRHLELFDLMYTQIDSMHIMTNDIHSHCTSFPFCIDGDCVWPGDFNHDGIADHRDLLYWSVMKESSGAKRNGLISWRGHYADDWTENTPDQLNHKHGDATGNGLVDGDDLNLNLEHFGFVDPNKLIVDQYPAGDDLVILGEPMDADGDIDDIRIVVGTDIPEIYGLSFQLEYDTFFFEPDLPIVQQYPFDSQGLHFNEDIYTSGTAASSTIYSAAGSNGENVAIPANTQLIRIPFGIDNKHQLPLQLLPDTIQLRLKNLVGVDKDGKDLQLGAIALKVPNALLTASNDPLHDGIVIYPNPVRDRLYIKADQSESVIIYTSIGLPVMHHVADARESYIDVSALPSGLYYLQLPESHRVGRFVKE